MCAGIPDVLQQQPHHGRGGRIEHRCHPLQHPHHMSTEEALRMLGHWPKTDAVQETAPDSSAEESQVPVRGSSNTLEAVLLDCLPLLREQHQSGAAVHSAALENK